MIKTCGKVCMHTSNASVATAQKENRVSISPVKTNNCHCSKKLYTAFILALQTII